MARKTLAIAASLLIALGVALAPGGRAAAQADDASQRADVEDVADLDQRAIDILRRAAQFLRSQPSFSVTMENSYDTLQPGTGEKLEFGAVRRISVRRPDRMRVETQPRGGSPRITTFDGRLLTVLDLEQNAYAQVERAGDLDATLDFLRDDLMVPLPLAELWRSDPSRDLEADLRIAYVAGTDRLDGVSCDRVFLRNDHADGQFWIEQGEVPRFHRVVITYRHEEAQPALRAQFSDWSFAPELSAQLFQFSPPEGSQRILFAVRPRATSEEEAQ